MKSRIIPALFFVLTLLLFAFYFQSAQNPSRHSGYGTALMLISEEKRTLLCYIQKNGCSHAIKIFFNEANRTYTQWSDLVPPADEPLPLSPWAETYGKKYLKSAFNKPSFARIVYVRDPAERLLSGFLEKCTSNNKVQRQNHCVGFNNASEPIPTFAQFVEKLTKQLIKSNSHFRPQAQFCSLGAYSQRFNIVIDLSNPNHEETLRNTYSKLGFSQRNIDISYPVAQHVGVGHSFAAHKNMAKYYRGMNSSLLVKVYRLFAEDYDMLRDLGVDMLSWAYPPPDHVRLGPSEVKTNSHNHLKDVEAVIASRQEELQSM